MATVDISTKFDDLSPAAQIITGGCAVAAILTFIFLAITIHIPNPWAKPDHLSAAEAMARGEAFAAAPHIRSPFTTDPASPPTAPDSLASLGEAYTAGTIRSVKLHIVNDLEASNPIRVSIWSATGYRAIILPRYSVDLIIPISVEHPQINITNPAEIIANLFVPQPVALTINNIKLPLLQPGQTLKTSIVGE